MVSCIEAGLIVVTGLEGRGAAGPSSLVIAVKSTVATNRTTAINAFALSMARFFSGLLYYKVATPYPDFFNRFQAKL